MLRLTNVITTTSKKETVQTNKKRRIWKPLSLTDMAKPIKGRSKIAPIIMLK